MTLNRVGMSPFRGNLSCTHLVLLCVNQYTVFAVPIFTASKDTIGGHLKRVT